MGHVWMDVICQKICQKVKIPVFIRLIGQKPDLSSKYIFKCQSDCLIRLHSGRERAAGCVGQCDLSEDRSEGQDACVHLSDWSETGFIK